MPHKQRKYVFFINSQLKEIQYFIRYYKVLSAVKYGTQSQENVPHDFVGTLLLFRQNFKFRIIGFNFVNINWNFRFKPSNCFVLVNIKE